MFDRGESAFDALKSALIGSAFLVLSLCCFSLPSAAQTDDELRTLTQQGNIAKIEQYARAGNARAQGLFSIMLAEARARRRGGRMETRCRKWRRFTIHIAGAPLVNSISKKPSNGTDVAPKLAIRTLNYSYAWSLRKGRGVPRDDVESFKWFLAAAKGRQRGAYVALAEMYALGEGTERDLVEALANIEIAVRIWPRHTFVHASRYEQVRELKAKLVAQASPTQISEAMRRARELRPDLKF